MDFSPSNFAGNAGVGGYGGFGGGGDGGIWLILALSLFGHGKRDGDGDCAREILVNQNLNGRFDAITNQIQSGDDAILASQSTQNMLAAVYGVGSAVCNSNALTAAGFTASNALSVAGFSQARFDTLTLGTTLGNSISEAKFQALLQAERLGTKIDTCCCATQMGQMRTDFLIQQTKCEIIKNNDDNTRFLSDKMTAAEICDLKTRLAAAELAASQAQQTASIVGAIRPYPVPAYQACNPLAAPAQNYQYGSCGLL